MIILSFANVVSQWLNFDALAVFACLPWASVLTYVQVSIFGKIFRKFFYNYIVTVFLHVARLKNVSVMLYIGVTQN